jgi:hypothetical protein
MANRKPSPKKIKGSEPNTKGKPTKGGIKGAIKSIKDRKAMLDAL